MPRDGSGVYSKPAGTTASPNTTIESAKYNSVIDDQVVDANTARPITAGGTGATTAVGGADAFSTKGTNIASATTTDIGAATGRFVHITGTTTITGLGTKTAGVEREVVFDGILTLTHNATSLILPGAANITTAAGDTAVIVSEGSGNWRLVSYLRGGSITNDARGLDIASAATLVLDGATGNFINVTGSTNVTAVTLANGRLRAGTSTTSFAFVAGASLIVNGSSTGTYVVNVDDYLNFVGYAAGVVRVWITHGSLGVAFSANKNAVDQTGISSATLTFGTEVFDVGGYYDTSTSRWTPPPGRYRIHARVLISAGVVDQTAYTLSLAKNGTAAYSGVIRASGNGSFSMDISESVNSSGTDFWEVQITSGGANISVSGAIAFTTFSGEKIS